MPSTPTSSPRDGGRSGRAGATTTPVVDAATATAREALLGFKVVRVDSEVKK